MSSIDERVIELETRSAEQQQTIDELSDMIAQQWRKIDEMTMLGKVLKGRLQSLEEKLPDDDVPPPHY
jgi:SlyX protein